MHDILDLTGASGATYRFRRWSRDQPHKAIAGNYVIVAENKGHPDILLIGETTDLARAVSERARSVASNVHIFTRLNIARVARETEHGDLLAVYPAATAQPSGD